MRQTFGAISLLKRIFQKYFEKKTFVGDLLLIEWKLVQSFSNLFFCISQPCQTNITDSYY